MTETVLTVVRSWSGSQEEGEADTSRSGGNKTEVSQSGRGENRYHSVGKRGHRYHRIGQEEGERIPVGQEGRETGTSRSGRSGEGDKQVDQSVPV